jgi:hypothetical protein
MLDLKHGGHVLPEGAEGAKDLATKLGLNLSKKPPVGTTPFDYLLPGLKKQADAHIPGDPATVTANLKALGAAMVDSASGVQTDPAVEVNSNIPAVYTYWGQFIDHDMTANTDRDSTTSDITKTPLIPLDPDKVARICATCAARPLTSTTSMATGRALKMTTSSPIRAARTRSSMTGSGCAWAITPMGRASLA